MVLADSDPSSVGGVVNGKVNRGKRNSDSGDAIREGCVWKTERGFLGNLEILFVKVFSTHEKWFDLVAYNYEIYFLVKLELKFKLTLKLESKLKFVFKLRIAKFTRKGFSHQNLI